MLFSMKRGYGEMSEFSHQAGISKLRDKVAILPRHGVRHPHEEVSGVQEGEAVRLPPMSHLRSRPHFVLATRSVVLSKVVLARILQVSSSSEPSSHPAGTLS